LADNDFSVVVKKWCQVYFLGLPFGLNETFLSKVFGGQYKDMKKWISGMAGFVKSRGKETKKLYFFYTTCPKCAKFYGKNYVVILAQI